jgi:hypothetical protein
MSRPFVGDFEVLGAMRAGDFHDGNERNGACSGWIRLLARGGNGDRFAGVAHLDIDPIGVRRTDVAAGFDESDEVEALANEAEEFAFARADEGK